MKAAFSFCGALALFLFGSPLRADQGFGEPRLVFGVLSDVHIKNAGDTNCFHRALTYFRDQAVDAVVICGDIADRGRVDELQRAADTWFSVFPGDALPSGKRVERLFVAGNHDWNTGYNVFANDRPELLRYDFRENWRKIWKDESYEKIWKKTVKGYVFVGNHWDCTGWKRDARECSSNVPVYDDLPDWLVAHRDELTGPKPFFYIQHAHPKGSCFGDRAWGHDTGKNAVALSGFPNAVVFSGHSHFSLTDERSLWQGAFTSVNAGSLKVPGLDDALPHKEDYEYENGRSGGEKTMKMVDKRDGRQGMLVSVYDGAIVYHRREFFGEKSRPLGKDWVQPLPASEHRGAVDFSVLPPPEFPAGATVVAKSVVVRSRVNRLTPAATFEFPAAVAVGEGLRPYLYELAFAGEGDAKVVRLVVANGFHLPPDDPRALAPMTATFADTLFPSGATVRVTITPLSSFRTRGKPISAEFDGEMLRKRE